MNDRTISLWQKIKKNLKEELPEASFETWVGNLEVDALQGSKMQLSAPSGFIKRGFEERYLELTKEQIKNLSGKSREVVVKVDSPPVEENQDQRDPFYPPPVSSTDPTNGEEKQNNCSADGTRENQIALNKQYTFDTFVNSKSNQLASAASRAISEAPAEAYNPLFIYSKVGLGKTHLLHAIGNYLYNRGSLGKVVYTTSERFAIEMIQAIRQNRTEEFRQRYRSVSAFLLDDVQFMENKEGTQEELFHTFNELYGNKKQIALTSDRPPQELSDLQNRLVSRFRWGLVADIQPPNFETRVAILRKKALQKDLKVDDQVLELIASRITTNVRALEGGLIKAVAQANLANGKLTLDEIKNFLPDESTGEEELTVSKIKKKVANNYGVKPETIDGKSRKKEIARARHIAIYLARELTDNSFPSLGNKFGGRDHSTVMHSHKKVKNMIAETPLFSEEIEEIKRGLKSNFTQ